MVSLANSVVIGAGYVGRVLFMGVWGAALI